jgi:hypothetical protein
LVCVFGLWTNAGVTPDDASAAGGAVWLFRGILLLVAAVLGEYIGWLLLLSRKTPQYVVKKTPSATRSQSSVPGAKDTFRRHETL